MEKGRVRMVCFDAGGVLVRICRSWREGCGAAGVEFRWNDDVVLGEAARRDLGDAYQRGLLSCGEYFRGVAETTAGLYSPEEIRLVHDAWILGEYDGVCALIRDLHSLGLATGLLSNTSASHWAQRHMLGGRGVSAVGLVAHPHASHLLGLIKPDPAVYGAFERETGFRGREILFFDDLPENVAGARRSGWRAELIDHERDTAPQILGFLCRHGVAPEEWARARGPGPYNPPACP